MTNHSVIKLCLAILMLAISASGKSSDGDLSKPANPLAKATSELVNATNQYIASIETLLPIYEKALQSATESLDKQKRLYAQGLASKHDFEMSLQTVTAAQVQLEAVRHEFMEASQLLAEAKAEEEMAKLKPAPPQQKPETSRYRTTSAVLRYSGSVPWSLAQANRVQIFFTATFGRQLPISAYGQSATHNRMGFDHRNSMDVAVNPDSTEGKALIAYLRSNGIPYLAFRYAVPGVATGAHIHVGYPSHRL